LPTRLPSLYGDHVLTDEQTDEFARRGFILVPQVAERDVLARASERIDENIRADPPPAERRRRCSRP
jgi:hypothetical protein